MPAVAGEGPRSELSFFDTNIPCLAACPVNTNAGMYVAAIADGDDELAYLTARLPNPFASVCGRVCAAPCEDACRRGAIDEPIAIRALKRFVTEQFGPENHDVDSGSAPLWDVVAPQPGDGRTEHVAIVGGGPAGMAAAHDLRRHGYQVTVFEATDRLGGAMWLGIPEYRLDRTVLQRDVDAIVDLGVEVRTNTRLGSDITLEELRSSYDAVFVAIGATLGRGLDIEGGDADGVLRAIEFLINMNRGFEVDLGERVVVIGGGDVAMDAARTALRADDYEAARDGRAPIADAVDVARTAVRAGARDITVMALEARDEMPAHDFEVAEAEEEGIAFRHRRAPRRILVEEGRVVGIETAGVLSVFDADGRFAPEFDEDDIEVIDADSVVLAIGQAIDIEALGDGGPEVSQRRTIAVDDDRCSTSLPDVWAGGDAAKGPRTLIDAIADGRRAAADIHRAFGGEAVEAEQGRLEVTPNFGRLRDLYDGRARIPVATVETSRRVGLREVELGFTEAEARQEAARCLRCFANVVLDIEKCVLCALCVDVCPVDVLSLVPADEAVPGAPHDQSALLLDEERCIRCALCIERCPPDALSMATWTGIGVPVCP